MVKMSLRGGRRAFFAILASVGLASLAVAPAASADTLRTLNLAYSCATGLPYGLEVNTGSGWYYPNGSSHASGTTKYFVETVRRGQSVGGEVFGDRRRRPSGFGGQLPVRQMPVLAPARVPAPQIPQQRREILHRRHLRRGRDHRVRRAGPSPGRRSASGSTTASFPTNSGLIHRCRAGVADDGPTLKLTGEAERTAYALPSLLSTSQASRSSSTAAPQDSKG